MVIIKRSDTGNNGWMTYDWYRRTTEPLMMNTDQKETGDNVAPNYQVVVSGHPDSDHG